MCLCVHGTRAARDCVLDRKGCLDPDFVEELRRLSRASAQADSGEDQGPLLEAVADVRREMEAAQQEEDASSGGEEEDGAPGQLSLVGRVAADLERMELGGAAGLASMGLHGAAGRKVVLLPRVGPLSDVAAMLDGGAWRNTITLRRLDDAGWETFAPYFIFAPMEVKIGHHTTATQPCVGVVELPVRLTPASRLDVLINFYVMYTPGGADTTGPPIYLAGPTIQLLQQAQAAERAWRPPYHPPRQHLRHLMPPPATRQQVRP